MEKLLKNEIQNSLLNILAEFDFFCRSNDLTYCLGWGSAIGAVLYNGFIPWDDDIDVCMPRKDYEKFLKLYKNNNKFTLNIPFKTKEYFYPFAKLCDNSTYCQSNSLRDRFGVFIDIIPFDYIKKEADFSKNDTIELLNFGYFCVHKKPKFDKAYYGEQKGVILKFKLILSHFKTLFVYRFCRLFLKKKVNKIIKKFEGDDFYCHLVWSPKPRLLPKNYFEDRKEVLFAGIKTFICKDYDNDLKMYYGDYTIIPPPEKRKEHSFYSFYKKNNFVD